MLAERQAAVSAVVKAGHIPAEMELFTAGDELQMEVSERSLDDLTYRSSSLADATDRRFTAR